MSAGSDMTYDVAEHCTCGTQLTVMGAFQGQPITRCAHCDQPLDYQADHPGSVRSEKCGRCDRYHRHVSRIFPR